NNKLEINLNIKEVEKPDLDAQIVLNGIISSLEKRIPFRKVAKRALIQVRQAGAEGVKVIVKGRLDGSEIARTETFSEGKIPLHTLRAKIDYAQGGAHTTYGVVGAKVWIYTGEVFKEKKSKK
ncbi:MAG: 30S ribosomal protein S3, partial [uncultured bacterium]